MRRFREFAAVAVMAFSLTVTSVFADETKPDQQQPSLEQKATEQKAEQKTEEPKVTGSASAGFLSQYVFRGYQNSFASMVIQPSVTVNYYGFSANVWGNLDTKQHTTPNFHPDNPGETSWNETDLTISYTYNIDKLALTGGYIYYGTDYTKQTQELFLSAAVDVITKPVLTIYQDIQSYCGTYFTLGLSHSFPVYQGITVDLGALFSYEWGQSSYWQTYNPVTRAYTGSKYSAFHAGMLSAGVSIPVTKSFVVQPILQWWFPLSSNADKTYFGGIPYNPNGPVGKPLVYGVNLTLNF